MQSILLTMVDREEAEDLTQEVGIAALQAVGALKEPASFPSWLCAIARNAGRDALAAHRASSTATLEQAAAEPVAPEVGDPTAADEIIAEIRKLPECYREPLMLRLLLEMTGPEIARQTGLTPGSVRVNLCKGMKLLRQRLSHWE